MAPSRMAEGRREGDTRSTATDTRLARQPSRAEQIRTADISQPLNPADQRPSAARDASEATKDDLDGEVGTWDEDAFTTEGQLGEVDARKGGVQSPAAARYDRNDPFPTTLFPHLTRLSRQASFAAASSDSEITYADVPVDAKDVTEQFAPVRRASNVEDAGTGRSGAFATGSGMDPFNIRQVSASRAAVPRAASPFFAPSSAARLSQPVAAAAAGLPPSAFSLARPPSTDLQRRPLSLAPPRLALRASRSGTADSRSASRLHQQQQQPDPTSLLDAFLAADRAVKENRPPPATRSRVEEWRAGVVDEGGVAMKKGGKGGFTEEKGEDKRELTSEEEEERAEEEDDDAGEGNLVHPKAMEREAGSPRRARGSFSPPSASPSGTSPLPSDEPKRKSPIKKKATKKGNARHDFAPAGGDEGRKRRRITTRDTVAMLPARRKVFRVREDSEGEDEGSEASEAETDYELFSSPKRRRPSTRTKPSAGEGVYGAKKQAAKGRRGKKRREDEDEEDEEDSADERRKEAARKKWAAVDGYELETRLTL